MLVAHMPVLQLNFPDFVISYNEILVMIFTFDIWQSETIGAYWLFLSPELEEPYT